MRTVAVALAERWEVVPHSAHLMVAPYPARSIAVPLAHAVPRSRPDRHRQPRQLQRPPLQHRLPCRPRPSPILDRRSTRRSSPRQDAPPGRAPSAPLPRPWTLPPWGPLPLTSLLLTFLPSAPLPWMPPPSTLPIWHPPISRYRISRPRVWCLPPWCLLTWPPPLWKFRAWDWARWFPIAAAAMQQEVAVPVEASPQVASARTTVVWRPAVSARSVPGGPGLQVVDSVQWRPTIRPARPIATVSPTTAVVSPKPSSMRP